MTWIAPERYTRFPCPSGFSRRIFHRNPSTIFDMQPTVQNPEESRRFPQTVDEH